MSNRLRAGKPSQFVISFPRSTQPDHPFVAMTGHNTYRRKPESKQVRGHLSADFREERWHLVRAEKMEIIYDLFITLYE